MNAIILQIKAIMNDNINTCLQIDQDVMAYICHPVGTELIRVSSDAFEIDEHKKPAFLEKS